VQIVTIIQCPCHAISAKDGCPLLGYFVAVS
jgi:hypothetical protein